MSWFRMVLLAGLFWGATTSVARAAVIECVVEEVTAATYICRDKSGNLLNLARGIGDYGVGDFIQYKTNPNVRYRDYEVVAVRAPELVLRDRAGNLITLREHLKGFREGDLARYVLPGAGQPADYLVVRNTAPLVQLRDKKGKEILLQRDPRNLKPGDRVEYDRRRNKLRKDKKDRDGEG